MQQQNTILIKPFQMMGRNLILHIQEGAHILDKYEYWVGAHIFDKYE